MTNHLLIAAVVSSLAGISCTKSKTVDPVKPPDNGGGDGEASSEASPSFERAVRLCLGAFLTGTEIDVAIEPSREVSFTKGESTQISKQVLVEPHVEESKSGWFVTIRTSLYQPECEDVEGEACWDREAALVCTFEPGRLPENQAAYVAGRPDFKATMSPPPEGEPLKNDAVYTLLD